MGKNGTKMEKKDRDGKKRCKIYLSYTSFPTRGLSKVVIASSSLFGVRREVKGRGGWEERKGRGGKGSGGKEGEWKKGRGMEGLGGAKKGKGREGMGREGKGREGMGREGQGKGREGRGREGRVRSVQS